MAVWGAAGTAVGLAGTAAVGGPVEPDPWQERTDWKERRNDQDVTNTLRQRERAGSLCSRGKWPSTKGSTLQCRFFPNVGNVREFLPGSLPCNEMFHYDLITSELFQ